MKTIKVEIKNGKRRIFITNTFVDSKEDVRKKAANVVLGQYNSMLNDELNSKA